jgi:8-amino-7-oxononanoate synthase
VCSDQVKRLLISTGRPGIYSTALPAPAVAAAAAALAHATPQLRAALTRNVLAFRRAIGQTGDTGGGPADTAGELALSLGAGAAFPDGGPSLNDSAWEPPAAVSSWGYSGCSPIVPIYLGTEQAALDASARLQAAGFLVPAIRPPTVPPGTARLRVAISAAHTRGEIEAFASALKEAGVLRQRDEAAAGA